MAVITYIGSQTLHWITNIVGKSQKDQNKKLRVTILFFLFKISKNKPWNKASRQTKYICFNIKIDNKLLWVADQGMTGNRIKKLKISCILNILFYLMKKGVV